MTMRYLGGGHKRRYRMIDFLRTKDGIKATVKTGINLTFFIPTLLIINYSLFIIN